MNYVSDPYVTHDDLDELVVKRGKEGWVIHRILEVKHWDTAAVTIIWEASPYLPVPAPPPQKAGELLTGEGVKCGEEHNFVVSGTDRTSKCENCGITIEEFVNEHS
jgi:hypothetical protein